MSSTKKYVYVILAFFFTSTSLVVLLKGSAYWQGVPISGFQAYLFGLLGLGIALFYFYKAYKGNN
jgi:hypothetical protein